MLCPHCFREVNTTGACPFCGFDPASTAGKYPLALHPGSILNGRYILGHVLGQGGFGITYIALDYQTKERVAIKEYLPTDFAGRSTGSPSVLVYSGDRAENFAYGKAQFLEEAKTLAAFIGNAGIVRIDSYFEENGTAYFCMEYVDGLPLDKYMAARGGRLTPAEADRLLLPLMESLETVHAKGIVHRDIAPDNILVTKEGQAKLIDFGAARYSTGEKSRSLDVILKHGFAPVEQYTRRGRQGPWTDVYALAATYYYAITGKVLPESVDRMQEDELLKPSALGVKISPDQEGVLLKALVVSASGRFQSMEAFRRAMYEASPAAKAEAERRERALREELARLERERQAREKAEREAREKAAREEQERRRHEEEERKVREKAEREARERKKREAKAEAERLKREEKERRAREKAAANEKEKQEKAAQREAERQEQETKRQTGAAGVDEAKKPKLPLILGAVAVLAVVLFLVFGSKGQTEAPAMSSKPVETAAGTIEPTIMPTPKTTPEPTQDMQEISYAEAEAYLLDGLPHKAFAAFRELGDYRDADERAEQIAHDMRVKNSVPLAAGMGHTVGLRADGTVVAVGYNASGQCEVSGWTDIVAVAAGWSHTVGLKADGTVVATEYTNTDERLPYDGQSDVSEWTDIVAVSAGTRYTVGLRADGTVVATHPRNDFGQSDVSEWTDIVAVAAGWYHTVGLKADGTVIATEFIKKHIAYFGQCDVFEWTDIVAIAASQTITVGLKADGTVVVTEKLGERDHGERKVSNWTDIVAIAASDGCTVGLKADGTVVAAGRQMYGQCDVVAWSKIIAIAAGERHTVGLRTNGKVYSVGSNELGERRVNTWFDIAPAK